ncbi:hypothetical protein Bca101_056161 [Brassica carinata]
MPRYGSFAAVGSRIYVFDGIKSYFIDCRSHTMQHLPSMPVHMHYTVADVSSGRIYVFGFLGTYPDWSYAMLVFDTETKTWEGPMTVPVMQIGYGCLVVMADKMYMTDFENSFVYDPKESKWETEEMLNSKSWQYPCVVDDVLYYYDWSDRVLREYDSEHKCWQVVKEIIGEICFAKISMQRCKGQIWGKVDQWCDHGLIAGFYKSISSSHPEFRPSQLKLTSMEEPFIGMRTFKLGKDGFIGAPTMDSARALSFSHTSIAPAPLAVEREVSEIAEAVLELSSMDLMSPSGRRFLRERLVKLSAKAKEMQLQYTGRGRGNRGRGNRGRGSG